MRPRSIISIMNIMHWYSGSISVMDEALSRGYYFSINHQMLNSANGRKIIGHIPLDRVLFESDAPFTTGMGTTYSIEFQDRIYRYLCESAGVTETEIEHGGSRDRDDMQRNI